MKIIRLSSENVKRLKAVEITPDGEIVKICGRNAQGKTSILDSIEMLFSGGASLPPRPIRDGEASTEIEAEIGAAASEYTIRRTITPKGSYLKVLKADGSAVAKPQEWLDSLCPKLAYDPLAFTRMDPKRQVELLRKLVGLDFTAMDAERADAFGARTELNRQAKALEARMAAMPMHDDAPAEEVSVADLSRKLLEGQKHNAANDRLDNELEQEKLNLSGLELRQKQAQDSYIKRIADINRKIAELEEQKSAIAAEKQTAEAGYASAFGQQANKVADLERAVSGMRYMDLATVQAEIGGAEAINRKVRENADRLRQAREVSKIAKEADALTSRIEAIDKEKGDQLRSAKFPVPGMSFTSAGVLFNGIPLEQCSSAEMLRISVAMGVAMNPKLKVLLVRDGSLLDRDSLKALAELARASEAQVWMECVSEGGGDGSFLIEDGEVVCETEATVA